MKTEYVPPTEIGKQRHAWFKEHAKPEMIFDEALWLNDEALHLLPMSGKELNAYLIYSIGADRRDDGGHEKPTNWEPGNKTNYDITFTVGR